MIKQVYRWRYGLHSDGPYDKDFEAVRDAHGWTCPRPDIQTLYVKVEVEE